MAEQRIDRRHIIKGAGALSAFGVLAAWAGPLAAHADEGPDAEGAHWTYTIAIDSIANDANWIALYGCGTITPSQVKGGGTFVHFDHATPKPRAIRASGTWKARALLGFAPRGAFGVLVAGVLKMQVDLIALEGTLVPPGQKQARIPASVQVVVNVHNGGLETGVTEGVTLTYPNGLTFLPVSPPLGQTMFSLISRKGDGAGAT